MAELERIYLDNAATSWPKPSKVVDEIANFYRDSGQASSRSSGGDSTDRALSTLRNGLARFIGAEYSDEIVFAFNATDALNVAIHGCLQPGDHAVTTSLEHNSVMRPLNFLKENSNVEFDVVETNAAGVVDPQCFADAIRAETKMVCVSHVSNVTGVVQPVEEIGKICRQRGVLFLCDAAQSVGHVPVNVATLNCDLLAAPGHKGLYGPLGTGVLYVSRKLHETIVPMRQGGTGSASDVETQPTQMPYRLESGNINVGGLMGLQAGLDFVNRVGLPKIVEKDNEFNQLLIDGLRNIKDVVLYFAEANERTSVLSFNVGRNDPREVATILLTNFGIEVRAGLQCAPRMHKMMNTFQRGGTIRVSPGYFNTIDEIGKMVEAIEEVASM